jgi:hypothetical protein
MPPITSLVTGPDLAQTLPDRNRLAIIVNNQVTSLRTAHTPSDKVLGKAQSTKRNQFH